MRIGIKQAGLGSIIHFSSFGVAILLVILFVVEKWVGLTFFANAGARPMAWMHHGFIRELQQLAA